MNWKGNRSPVGLRAGEESAAYRLLAPIIVHPVLAMRSVTVRTREDQKLPLLKPGAIRRPAVRFATLLNPSLFIALVGRLPLTRKPRGSLTPTTSSSFPSSSASSARSPVLLCLPLFPSLSHTEFRKYVRAYCASCRSRARSSSAIKIHERDTHTLAVRRSRGKSTRKGNGARFQIRAQFAGALVRALVIVFLRERAPGVRPFAFRRPRDSGAFSSTRLDSTRLDSIVKQRPFSAPKQPCPARLRGFHKLSNYRARASSPFFRARSDARGRTFHRDRVTFPSRGR